jgi:DNA-binding GntR family transcriptional regulator
MKRITVRTDLMSKSEYSKQYGVNRMTIDRMIQDGKLFVERISGTDYIKLSMGKKY